MPLTGKKLAFAKAVRSGKSHRDAAVIAGYSEKTCSQTGSRLARDPDVKAYLKEMQRRSVSAKKAVAAKKTSPDVPSDDLFQNDDDPREFLRKAMRNVLLDPRQRLDAAKALLPYEHQRIGEGGKKLAAAGAAKAAAGGKFGARPPPRLVSSK